MYEQFIHAAQWILKLITPLSQHHPGLLLLIAGFIAGNLAFYYFTRGKEFIVMAYASLLFLVPFVRIG